MKLPRCSTVWWSAIALIKLPIAVFKDSAVCLWPLTAAISDDCVICDCNCCFCALFKWSNWSSLLFACCLAAARFSSPSNATFVLFTCVVAPLTSSGFIVGDVVWLMILLAAVTALL